MGLGENFSRVNDEIKKSITEAGRKETSVKLVAVSKTVGSDKIRELFALGQRDFGESRPQVLRDKCKNLVDLPINWHFIGHLQSNKIKYVYPIATLVHSVDRVELLEEFIEWAKKTGRKCPILLQADISREESKQGFPCEDILDVIKNYSSNEFLDIRGLMGMAPLNADEEQIETCFKELAELFEASKRLEGVGYKAQELSMGMSGDFPIAISQGATLVRVGSAIFTLQK